MRVLAAATLLLLALAGPVVAGPLSQTFGVSADHAWTTTERVLKVLGWDIDKADREIGWLWDVSGRTRDLDVMARDVEAETSGREMPAGATMLIELVAARRDEAGESTLPERAGPRRRARSRAGVRHRPLLLR